MQTNVKVETLELFKHAETRVAIIVANGIPGYDNILHTFLTNDALAAWLKEHREKHPDVDFRYVEDSLGAAVNFTIWNPVDGISIHSVTDASFDVTREDLSALTDLFDSFRILTATKKGKTSVVEAAMHMKNKTVYFIGNMPEEGQLMEKKDLVFGKTIVKRHAADGTSYEAIAAFLTEESALHFAEKPVPVNACKLSKLASLWGFKTAVLIEPERSFCVDFAPEGLL